MEIRLRLPTEAETAKTYCWWGLALSLTVNDVLLIIGMINKHDPSGTASTDTEMQA